MFGFDLVALLIRIVEPDLSSHRAFWQRLDSVTGIDVNLLFPIIRGHEETGQTHER